MAAPSMPKSTSLALTKNMRLTETVHARLKDHLCEGDLAIDATAGNGYDTVFLAEQIGSTGRVIAIDIQSIAIDSTHRKLAAAHLEDRVTLLVADHRIELESLVESQPAKVAALLFNLGYLPGSDKSVQTQQTNTVKALDASILLLRQGGLLCVTAYRGHIGGLEEAQSVESWMRSREAVGDQVECFEPTSNNTPPILWILRKA